LLPSTSRPHVHALYAFARYADDIVDDLGDATIDVREKALASFGDRFFDDLATGQSSDAVLKAVVHTARAYDIDPEYFHRFMRSMTMDLTVSSYDSWDELLSYMDGSAAVIGEMMIPILEPTELEKATQCARALGNAFQLTNFLRDIDEDLTRGRTYVPLDDIRAHGAEQAFNDRRCSPEFVALMKFEIARCRELYTEARPGADLLPERSARCVRAATHLYSGILDRIEDQHYDVFSSRARVPGWEKAATAMRTVLPPSVDRRVAPTVDRLSERIRPRLARSQ